MSQSVLMIDAEQPFADNIAGALRGRGLDVTVVGDGKEGLDAARGGHSPAVIVLCVELPKMSGYSICNKLKKDDALKDIPLIITSSEATPETFEQHKKLKTRADGYLIKPFDAEALFEQMKALVPMDASAEEVIDLTGEELEAEVVSDVLADDGFDLSNLAGEVVGDDELASLETEDDDLSLDDELGLEEEPLNLEEAGSDALESFDDTFDALTEEPDEGGSDDAAKLGDVDLESLLEEEPEMEALEEPLALEELNEPAEAVAPAPIASKTKPAPSAVASAATAAAAAQSAAANTELEKQVRELRRENGDFQARVAELETRLKAAEDEARKKASDLSNVQTSTSSSARELLNLKQQMHEKEKELFRLKEEAFTKEKAAFEAEDKLAEMQRTFDDVSSKLSDRDATITSLNSKVATLTDERNTLEGELQGKIGQLEGQLAALAAERDQQVMELENDRDTRISAIEKERDTARSRLEAVEKVAGERADRIDTLTSELASKEEQIGELYSKTKNDGEIRERARKAVEIAQALLSGAIGVDEGGDEVLAARM